MNLKFKLYEKRIAGKDYRILVPEFSFDKVFACELERRSNIIFADKNNLIELSRHLRVIANEKSSILYIPCKKDATQYLKERWNSERAYDLVLSHHSIQLKHKDWKYIRNNLNQYKAVEYSVEEERIEREFRQFTYEENKDVLKVVNRYDTVFITASKIIFDYMVEDCLNVAEHGDFIFERYRAHDHAHLESYLGKHDRYGNYVDITIDYYDEYLWEEKLG